MVERFITFYGNRWTQDELESARHRVCCIDSLIRNAVKAVHLLAYGQKGGIPSPTTDS